MKGVRSQTWPWKHLIQSCKSTKMYKSIDNQRWGNIALQSVLRPLSQTKAIKRKPGHLQLYRMVLSAFKGEKLEGLKVLVSALRSIDPLQSGASAFLCYYASKLGKSIPNLNRQNTVRKIQGFSLN